jgi:proline dehydrogenase
MTLNQNLSSNRNPQHITHAIEDARKHGYSLGIKLVRGAYHGQEISYHQKRLAAAKPGDEIESEPAVWLHKDETDRCFDDAAKFLIEHVATSLSSRSSQHPKLGLLFGTHNKQSCQHVLDCMIDSKLARKDTDGRVKVKPGIESMVCFGQLYGTPSGYYVSEKARVDYMHFWLQVCVTTLRPGSQA